MIERVRADDIEKFRLRVPGAQGAQRIHRVGRSLADDLDIAARKPGLRHGQPHHFHARPPACARVFVWRIACGQKEHIFQVKLAHGKLRYRDVRVVHRVKRAAQNPNCQW